MSTIFIPDVVEENVAGIFATNPVRATLPVVAATTGEDRAAAHNRIRQELVVVACANLKETNFAFDSSFVVKEARAGFESLAKVIRRHPGAPMTLFGHADPEGPIHYNHFLSERRARAIHAVLVKDVSVWEALFSDPQLSKGDVWGVKSLQLMHDALLDPFPVVNSAPARALLFARYMDFLRGAPEANPPFPVLTSNDFLGRGRQKATLQGCSQFNPQLLLSATEQRDFDADKGKKALRDARNEPNRRVVIYFFAKGTVIDPSFWPCPAAVEGEAACEARQWSNGLDRRRKLFEKHRRRFGRAVAPDKRELRPANPKLADEIGQEETTFGCRFYHGIALHSPCERDLKLWGIKLLVDGPTPLVPPKPTDPIRPPPTSVRVPLANKRFVATIGTSVDAPVVRGTTTDQGFVALPLFDPNVQILLRVDAFATLAPPPPPPDPAAPKPDTPDSQAAADESTFLQLRLAAGSLKPLVKRDGNSLQFDPDFDDETQPPTGADRELAAMQRLYNLGFGSDDTGGDAFGNWTPEDRLRFTRQFQRENRIAETGILDAATVDALFTQHGS